MRARATEGQRWTRKRSRTPKGKLAAGAESSPTAFSVDSRGVPLARGFFTIPADAADAIDSLPRELRAAAIRGIFAAYRAGKAAERREPAWLARQRRLDMRDEQIRRYAAEHYPNASPTAATRVPSASTQLTAFALAAV